MKGWGGRGGQSNGKEEKGRRKKKERKINAGSENVQTLRAKIDFRPVTVCS